MLVSLHPLAPVVLVWPEVFELVQNRGREPSEPAHQATLGALAFLIRAAFHKSLQPDNKKHHKAHVEVLD